MCSLSVVMSMTRASCPCFGLSKTSHGVASRIAIRRVQTRYGSFRSPPGTTWVKSKVEYWDRSYSSPFVLYFHVWDLDPDQPKIHSAPTLAKIRAYRNLGKMRSILEEYLSTYRFGSIAEHLGINPQDGQGIACVENSVPGSSSDRQVHVPD